MTNVLQHTTFVLLAAGEGKRFPGPVHKLLAPLKGNAVVTHSVRAMVAAGGGTVITGAENSAEFLEALEGCPTVHNPDWASGQRSSVMLAIRTARQQGADQVVIGLADQPFVGPDAWTAVASADSPIAVATYGGRRGNPVKLRRDTWDAFEAASTEPDTGARTLFSLHPEWVTEVACQGSPDDIDTHEDFAKWI